MTEQPPYSLLVRGIDADVLPVAEQFGMGVLPWLLAHRSRSRLGDFMDNRDLSTQCTEHAGGPHDWGHFHPLKASQ
jgi:hypothetical protein